MWEISAKSTTLKLVPGAQRRASSLVCRCMKSGDLLVIGVDDRRRFDCGNKNVHDVEGIGSSTEL